MTAGTIGFVLCAVAAVVLIGLAHRDPEGFAPLDDLLDEVMLRREARVVIVLFWWWLGWHMLVD